MVCCSLGSFGTGLLEFPKAEGGEAIISEQDTTTAEEVCTVRDQGPES